jgi:hypothetical protein
MKALIATGIGVLGLGGLLVASLGRSASAQAQPAPVVMNSSSTGVNGPTLVNCGEGRQAVFFPAQTGLSRVECVARENTGSPMLPVSYSGMPNGAAQFADMQSSAPVPRTVVEERVVYRDRPVTRTTAARRSSGTTARRASASPTYSSSSPDVAYRKEPRSWKKSAVIIGGSTAAGAGVGAVLGGGNGAKKGAVVGLVGGAIYDIATRNKK